MHDSLRIAIVGRHPDLEIGFNGVMSLNECLGFSWLGHAVTLFLPVSAVFNPLSLIKNKNLNLSELDNGGGQFKIEILEPSSVLKESYNLVIWQTYRAEDDIYLDRFRGKGTVLSKNFPRLFGYDAENNRRKALGLAKVWDLPVCALKEDIDALESLDLDDRYLNTYKYVPRGFDQRLLGPAQKAEIPTIGFDKPIKAGNLADRSIQHIRQALLLVKEAMPDLTVLSLAADDPQLSSIKVPWSGYRNFYTGFINKLWLYMPVDFMYTVHAKGYSRSLDGVSHRFIGLYENQVVETQLAGGLVVSRRGDIPGELLAESLSDLVFEDYAESVNEIASRIVNVLQDFSSKSQSARSFALQNHTLEIMASKWLEAYYEHGQYTEKKSKVIVQKSESSKNIEEGLLVRMSPEERNVFEQLLKKTYSYIEFGLGGSTVLAVKNGVRKVFAVESDLEWINEVRKSIARYLDDEHEVYIHHADIGPVKQWGYPIKPLVAGQALVYHSEIWSRIGAEISGNIMVLVDGRYRVACVLQALKNLPQPFTLLIHDYRDRKSYHIVEKIIGMPILIDTLAVFEVMPNQALDLQLISLIDKYSMDAR